MGEDLLMLGLATVIAFEVAAVCQSAIAGNSKSLLLLFFLHLTRFEPCRVLRASLARQCMHFGSAGKFRRAGCLQLPQSTVYVTRGCIAALTISSSSSLAVRMRYHCQHNSTISWASGVAVHSLALASLAAGCRITS